MTYQDASSNRIVYGLIECRRFLASNAYAHDALATTTMADSIIDSRDHRRCLTPSGLIQHLNTGNSGSLCYAEFGAAYCSGAVCS